MTAAKRLLDAGVGTDLQRFSVLYGLCAANYIAARMEPALALARQIVEVADRQDDPIYRLVGYRLLGTMQVFMGRNREALESLQQAERYRDPVRQKLLSYRFGYDPGLAVLCYKIWALTVPRPPRSGGASQRAGAWPNSQATDTPPPSQLCTFLHVVWPELLFGDLEACERHSAELVAYCAEKKVEQFRLYAASSIHACARATREPTEENIAALRAAIDAQHRSGARIVRLCVSISPCRSLADGGRCDGRRSGAARSLRLCRAIRGAVLACRLASR